MLVWSEYTAVVVVTWLMDNHTYFLRTVYRLYDKGLSSMTV